MPRIKRALISVSDKEGIVGLAAELHDRYAIEIISTGGTAKVIREANIPVREVSEYTGFPEIMGGRVKTINPHIAGGLLGRLGLDDAVMEKWKIEPIDLLVSNLYRFSTTVAKPDCTWEAAIEDIDIGGPGLVRAAAKNHERVTVLTRPDQYESFIREMQMYGGCTKAATRLTLAWEAFVMTAAYDRDINVYFAQHVTKRARELGNQL